MNRPFYGGGASGVAYLGQGINQGVQNGIKNLLDVWEQGTFSQRVDTAQRRQTMAEEQLKGWNSHDVSGAAPVVPSTSTGPISAALIGEEGPLGISEDKPPVGAEALAKKAAPTTPVASPPQPAAPAINRADPSQLSIDDLRSLAFERGKQSRANALSNENDREMLKQAYHYNAVMQQFKPHLDLWQRALTAAMKDPNNPAAYRGVQVLTGEEDPDNAYAIATTEYAKLRAEFDQYDQSYKPLNEALTARGITPDLYGDEAKFIQFMNGLQFKPHTPAAASSGASVLRRPSTRSAYGYGR